MHPLWVSNQGEFLKVIGMWRSWLAHLLWEQRVLRSSRSIPTEKHLQEIVSAFFVCPSQNHIGRTTTLPIAPHSPHYHIIVYCAAASSQNKRPAGSRSCRSLHNVDLITFPPHMKAGCSELFYFNDCLGYVDHEVAYMLIFRDQIHIVNSSQIRVYIILKI